jgi:hypothetical protein
MDDRRLYTGDIVSQEANDALASQVETDQTLLNSEDEGWEHARRWQEGWQKMQIRYEKTERELKELRVRLSQAETVVSTLIVQRDQYAQDIKSLFASAKVLADLIEANGNWDDGCFYFSGISNTIIKGPLEYIRATHI